MERTTRIMVCVLLVFAMAFVSAGCGKKTVQPMEFGTTVPESGGMTKKEVADAILRAGANSQWMITPVSDGVMDGILNYKNQTVAVTITYDERNYRIRYAGGQEGVLKQYNKWMSNLDARIRKELLQQARRQ